MRCSNAHLVLKVCFVNQKAITNISNVTIYSNQSILHKGSMTRYERPVGWETELEQRTDIWEWTGQPYVSGGLCLYIGPHTGVVDRSPAATSSIWQPGRVFGDPSSLPRHCLAFLDAVGSNIISLPSISKGHASCTAPQASGLLQLPGRWGAVGRVRALHWTLLVLGPALTWGKGS